MSNPKGTSTADNNTADNTADGMVYSAKDLADFLKRHPELLACPKSIRACADSILRGKDVDVGTRLEMFICIADMAGKTCGELLGHVMNKNTERIDVEMLTEVVDFIGKFDKRVYGGMTVIDLLAFHDYADCLEAIFAKRGAEIVECSAQLVRTPLLVACRAGATNAAEVLLKHFSATKKHGRGGSPVHAAARLRDATTLRMLIRHKVPVDEQAGREGRTPLQCAITAGSVACVRLLLRSGLCDLNKKDGDNSDAFDILGRTNVRKGDRAAIRDLFHEHLAGEAPDGEDPSASGGDAPDGMDLPTDDGDAPDDDASDGDAPMIGPVESPASPVCSSTDTDDNVDHVPETPPSPRRSRGRRSSSRKRSPPPTPPSTPEPKRRRRAPRVEAPPDNEGLRKQAEWYHAELNRLVAQARDAHKNMGKAFTKILYGPVDESAKRNYSRYVWKVQAAVAKVMNHRKAGEVFASTNPLYEA